MHDFITYQISCKVVEPVKSKTPQERKIIQSATEGIPYQEYLPIDRNTSNRLAAKPERKRHLMLAGMKAMPQPASNECLVRWSREVKAGDYLEITDVTGRIVLSYPLIEKQIQQGIDASLIPSGIYLCQLRNDNIIKDKTKVIVSR